MKYAAIIISILLIEADAYAEILSSCDATCFEEKVKCNGNRTHTFNNCNDELFVCRASCHSGKKQDQYETFFPIPVSFQPIFEN